MNMRVCSFASGLDDMKRKDQSDPVKVLRILLAHKRFSVFEATANQQIARTLTELERFGRIKTTPRAYPWTDCEVTEAGLALLYPVKR